MKSSDRAFDLVDNLMQHWRCASGHAHWLRPNGVAACTILAIRADALSCARPILAVTDRKGAA